MQEQVAFQKILEAKLSDARAKNPSYSLRSFSRRVGMSSSALSEILNGKRLVSRKLAERVAYRLLLTPEEVQGLLALFPAKRRRSSTESLTGLGVVGDTQKMRQALQLTADQFNTIADWYHFGILSLLETEGAKSEPQWISRRLGVPVRNVAQALERLERLGMLKRDDSGQLMLTGQSFTTSDGVPSLALRRAHAQNLELARNALDDENIDRRDFTAITMAIDPAKLPQARALIRQFRDQLSNFLEADTKTEVYKLCVQLIPLSNEEVAP
jgi:uncharacterized protein (TIGR02147 family)